MSGAAGALAAAVENSLRNALPIAPAGGDWACFDLKLSLVGSAASPLVPHPTLLHVGRRTAVGRCRIEDSSGRLVAVGSATFHLETGRGSD